MSEGSSARPLKKAWLLIPLVLAAIAVAAWCAYWFIARDRLLAAMDAQVAAQRADGREIEWAARRVEGFPYRFKVILQQARVESPSGWALRAPRLEAQANAYRLTRWVAAAPEGVVVVRPLAGPLHIDARSSAPASAAWAACRPASPSRARIYASCRSTAPSPSCSPPPSAPSSTSAPRQETAATPSWSSGYGARSPGPPA
jgi:hypothetical protein